METNIRSKSGQRPPRICLVIPGLGAGGAEHVLSQLANYWAAQGWAITLLMLADPESPVYYELDARISVRQLGLMKPAGSLFEAIRANVQRVWHLRRAIRDTGCDAVLSFIDQCNTLVLLATLGLGLPVVVSERSNPSQHQIGRIWNTLRLLLYPRAAVVTVQTQRAKAYFPAGLQRRIVVLPNMIPVHGKPRAPGADPVVGGVGRLSREKGFDLLIDAFATIASRHPQWRLVIWGEGNERAALQATIAALHMEDRIRLAGLSGSPGSWIGATDLFVLPSRYEGFPNALGEAMAAGLPAVAFDCPAGPREMIREGGILVPPQDVVALADALDRVMQDGSLRRTLAASARSDMARFAPEAVLADWTRLMGGVARPVGRTDVES